MFYWLGILSKIVDLYNTRQAYSRHNSDTFLKVYININDIIIKYLSNTKHNMIYNFKLNLLLTE